MLGISFAEFACFILFWVMQIAIIYRGVESIRILETLAAPFLSAIGLALLAWAYFSASGFSAMLELLAFDPGGEREASS